MRGIIIHGIYDYRIGVDTGTRFVGDHPCLILLDTLLRPAVDRVFIAIGIVDRIDVDAGRAHFKDRLTQGNGHGDLDLFSGESLTEIPDMIHTVVSYCAAQIDPSRLGGRIVLFADRLVAPVSVDKIGGLLDRSNTALSPAGDALLADRDFFFLGDADRAETADRRGTIRNIGAVTDRLDQEEFFAVSFLIEYDIVYRRDAPAGEISLGGSNIFFARIQGKQGVLIFGSLLIDCPGELRVAVTDGIQRHLGSKQRISLKLPFLICIVIIRDVIDIDFVPLDQRRPFRPEIQRLLTSALIDVFGIGIVLPYTRLSEAARELTGILPSHARLGVTHFLDLSGNDVIGNDHGIALGILDGIRLIDRDDLDGIVAVGIPIVFIKSRRRLRIAIDRDAVSRSIHDLIPVDARDGRGYIGSSELDRDYDLRRLFESILGSCRILDGIIDVSRSVPTAFDANGDPSRGFGGKAPFVRLAVGAVRADLALRAERDVVVSCRALAFALLNGNIGKLQILHLKLDGIREVAVANVRAVAVCLDREGVLPLGESLEEIDVSGEDLPLLLAVTIDPNLVSRIPDLHVRAVREELMDATHIAYGMHDLILVIEIRPIEPVDPFASAMQEESGRQEILHDHGQLFGDNIVLRIIVYLVVKREAARQLYTQFMRSDHVDDIAAERIFFVGGSLFYDESLIGERRPRKSIFVD